MNKVVKDGKVAVLYSPGYGAGWYTWNTNVLECLFHPEVVKLVEEKRHSEITDEYCRGLFGESFYAGGSHQLGIEWMPEGTRFIIDEYAGSESIYTIDQIQYITA